MVHHVKSLLGRTLRDEESLIIRPARNQKDAPTGDERERAHFGAIRTISTCWPIA